MVNYCINPRCKQRENSESDEVCQTCGTPLLINTRYRLLHPIRPPDSDLYTEVFEAELILDTFENKAGAHKIIKIIKCPDKQLIELMTREAHILRFNNDPGIPRCYFDDYFQVPIKELSFDLHCLAIQKIEGQDLQAWIEAGNRLSEQQALDWLKQISRILDIIHRKDFFHRDIKPSNIMLKPDGQLVLIDFGAGRDVTKTYLGKLSKPVDLDEQMFTFGDRDITLVRTVGYTPPEQLNGHALPQSDFYALGRTFVHLITGIHPKSFPVNPESGGIIWRHKARHIRKPLLDFIDRLMALLPADRPLTAQFIMQYVERRLPLEVKADRFINTVLFKFISVVLLGSFLVLMVKGLTLGASRYYYSQGLISFDTKQYKKAQSNFSIATQLDTKYVGAYNNLAASCKNLKDSNCAESSYKKAISLDENCWEPYYSLASFYEEQAHEKNRSESDKQRLLNLSRSNYKMALGKGGPHAVDALNNLSRLEILQKNYQAGIDIASQGIGLTQDPVTLGALYKNRGWAAFELGRVQDARKDLEHASKLDPDRADAHCFLAQLLEADRQPTLIKASLSQCLRTIAANPEIRALQDRLLDHLIGR